MRCTNNKKIISLALACLVMVYSLAGCGQKADPNAYRIYESSYYYDITEAAFVEETPLFAEDLCIPDSENIGIKKVDSSLAKSGAVFNNTSRKTIYSKKIYDKVYPASTTKILTAYIAIRYGNLDEIYTVSEHACDQTYDSSVAGLSPGDKITLRDLLFGLILASGNDAAIAIAEGIDGDEKTFVERMNKVAKKLGATDSHFVTPNGLHDEDHYTTAYDMYLIFSAALGEKEFYTILSTPEYTARFSAADNSVKEKQWKSTNSYITGERTAPDGITVIGGKTGTTGAAGYCLVMLSENSNKDQIISMVFDAENRYNLYDLMNQLLSKAG